MAEKYGSGLHSVEGLDGIIGNQAAVSQLRMFASEIVRGARRAPLLLHGPPGVGKSASAHLLAIEMGWNVVELNSSDYRDRESIRRKLLSAATSRSVFGQRNMVLLDEIDELAPRFDHGAGAEIGSLVGSAKNPVILIANDMWDQSISFLRGRVEPVEFKRLAAEDIKSLLLRISGANRMSVKTGHIEAIATRSNGDARSAINDLSVVDGCNGEVTEIIGMRDRKSDIFSILDKIFFANTLSGPIRAAATTDLDNDMLMKWIEENIPNRYASVGDIASAFASLSDASAYLTRAHRAQYYTYWRYMGALMSGGVALSKRSYPSSMKRYAFPRLIRELSATKQSRRYEYDMADRLRSRLHSSARRIAGNELRMLELMIRRSLSQGEPKAELVGQLCGMYGLEESDAVSLVKRAQ